jgi:hypothetical protein
MAAEHDWIAVGECIGSGPTRLITVEYRLQALASCEGQSTPIRQPGPWLASVALARGLACQPLVQLAASGGYLPVSGNISGFGAGEGFGSAKPAPPGLVCYAERWDPTQLTLAWVVFQVARIVVGEVLNFEAQPLSKSGRDFQASALARGDLPTDVVSAPRSELLYLQPKNAPLVASEIEFHES